MTLYGFNLSVVSTSALGARTTPAHATNADCPPSNTKDCPALSERGSDAPTQNRREEMLTFEQFSAANRARCEDPQGFKHPLTGWTTSDWMTAMVGEVGEAANVVKKLNRYRDGVPGNKVSEAELRDQLRKEIGDVFVYLDLMAQSLGFKIEDAAREVFNAKSTEIGYPKTL
jgi:NTP pyrophosphatase (non-canonical NTP hydrolase)